MSLQVLPWSPQFFDASGNPLSGGKVYTYTGGAGSTTPQSTYTTPTDMIANANPVVLDSAGRPTSGGIYLLHTSYRILLKDASGATVKDEPNVLAVQPEDSSYTPTLTNTTNVAATTAYPCQYIRIGNRVIVYFYVDIDPTLAAPTATEIQISLPVASDLTSGADVQGCAQCGQIAGQGGYFFADTVTNRARYLFSAVNTSNLGHSGSFMYPVQ